MDGDARTLYHPEPCRRRVCGDRVESISGMCIGCGAKYLRPQPGPQTQFLASPADVTLYGGSAYSGKSYALLLDALRHSNTPGWAGLILRRHANDYNDPTSIFEKAKKVYAGTAGIGPDGKPRDPVIRTGGYRDIRWPSGATLVFRHLDGVNIHSYQGMEYAWIGVDEATHFELTWLRYLITRMRTSCGSRPTMRMTCNPDMDHPIAEWVDPYLSDDEGGPADRDKSGMVRHWAVSTSSDKITWGDSPEACATAAERDVSDVKSFSFIAALLHDNPIGLSENPGYEANLAVAGRVEEAKLRYGKWRVRDETIGMLPWTSFGKVDAPLAPVVRWIRAWDPASTDPNEGDKKTDPDFTIGVLIGWDYHGRWYLLDVAVTREGTKAVDKLMASTAAQDGQKVQQQLEVEPGNGKVAAAHWTSVLRSSGRCGSVGSVPANKDKPTKAKPMARELILGMNGTTPREIEIEMEEGAPGVWSPRAFIVLGTWCEETYPNPGDHPKTKLALVKKQIGQFFKGGNVKDDIPDAMAIAHNAGSKPVLTRPSDLDRHRRMAGLST